MTRLIEDEWGILKSNKNNDTIKCIPSYNSGSHEHTTSFMPFKVMREMKP